MVNIMHMCKIVVVNNAAVCLCRWQRYYCDGAGVPAAGGDSAAAAAAAGQAGGRACPWFAVTGKTHTAGPGAIACLSTINSRPHHVVNALSSALYSTHTDRLPLVSVRRLS